MPPVLPLWPVWLVLLAGFFFGAWLGGKVFERSGRFDLVWLIGMALAVAAALAHLLIREAQLPPRTAAA